MNQQRKKHKKPNVLLVSIDALKPEFIFEQERLGVCCPFLTAISQQGCIAPEGMKSVFPPFTYPCHQSMITGSNPITHGIVNNAIFDPTAQHKGAWHWFSNKKVKTLWEAAKEGGYVVGSAAFPTSVGAKGDYIAPEFWWDGSAMDSLFIDAVSKPQGLIAEMEADIGQYAGGLNLSDAGDVQRYKAALWLLQHKLGPAQQEKPFFLSAYFASFDESAHQYGVYSREAAHSLEKIDAMVRKLAEAAQQIAGEKLVICIVSDHGTLDNTHTIYPNVLLRRAGLLETDEHGAITAWKAYSHRAGGICEIRLADCKDMEAKATLDGVMNLLAQGKNNGIFAVLTGEEARVRGGFPDADYVLISQKGYEIRDDAQGEFIRTTLTQKAQHGYNEEFPEMRASFLLAGAGISQSMVYGMRLIDVAPTLAAVMNLSLPDAEGHDVLA